MLLIELSGDDIVGNVEDWENIPEPKRTYKLEVGMVPFTTGLELRTDFRDFNGVKCRARVTYTEGEGWSIEEIKS